MFIPTQQQVQIAGATGQAEMAYVEFTSNVTVSAVTEAAGDSVVSAGSVAFDGSTIVMIEFYANAVRVSSNAGDFVIFSLWDGATNLGHIAQMQTPASAVNIWPLYGRRRLTPSNASHTYEIKAYRNVANGTVFAGAGGVATDLPGFIRITKA